MTDGAATALFEDAIFAVGGAVAATRPTTWIAPGLAGQLAVPCYVVVSEGAALLIDTGLAVHWETVRAGLDALLAGVPRRALIMTRREPEAISNLPAIVERYALDAVYCGGVISPLDFFERVDTLSTSMHIRAIAAAELQWLLPGADLQVGPYCLEVLPTTLRVLPKNHLYERRSRTLFASDTWGLLPQAEGGVGVVRTDELLGVSAITDYLRYRFEWLAGIDTAPMQQEVAELLASRPIDRICSSFGCVIEGRELVGTVLRRTVAALQALSREPRMPRLRQLDRVALAAALTG